MAVAVDWCAIVRVPAARTASIGRPRITEGTPLNTLQISDAEPQKIGATNLIRHTANICVCGKVEVNRNLAAGATSWAAAMKTESSQRTFRCTLMVMVQAILSEYRPGASAQMLAELFARLEDLEAEAMAQDAPAETLAAIRGAKVLLKIPPTPRMRSLPTMVIDL